MASASPSRPLMPEVRIPTADRPVWSRVGIVAIAGFVLGIAWPRLVGVQVGPSVPGDQKAKSDAAGAPIALAGSAPANDAATPPSASTEAPQPARRQNVVVGPGTISRCSDKKGKKPADCGTLDLDSVAIAKLESARECPAALGLDGAISVSLDVDFSKKQIHVAKGKKTSLPSSTVQGILQCIARDIASIALDEIPHQHRRYTVVYPLTFFAPGKDPAAARDGVDPPDPAAEREGAATTEGAAATEGAASGSATVAWDTALVRQQPKDGEVVARIVRGTRVKIVGKRSDWYKIEHGGKTGWIYRSAIGL